MILVSACLLGHNVKYSGGNNLCPLLAEYAAQGLLLPVCPECLGQLPIPRPPAEIQGADGSAVLNGTARVIAENGGDVTENFLLGADSALKAAQKAGIRYAILKARSPSCGCGSIYDGSFDGTLIKGDGVTAALLKQHGITVYTEADLTEELLTQLFSRCSAG